MHFLLSLIACFVGLALVLAVFYGFAFAVFGLYAVCVGIHPALGWAYVVAVWVVFLAVVIGKVGKHGKA